MLPRMAIVTRPPRASRRRTQGERSQATREALLDAAVDVLVHEGYAAATAAAVSRRAGLSRGAHLHHFGTRDSLIAATLERLAERMLDTHTLLDRQNPQDDRSADREGLEILWSLYTGPLFVAVIDIKAAARTDPALAATVDPLERTVSRGAHALCRDLFGAHAGRPDFDELMTFVLAAVRGVAILDVMRPDSEHQLRRWQTVRARLLTILEDAEPA